MYNHTCDFYTRRLHCVLRFLIS